MNIKIGLEIHLKINTKKKLFCFCDNKETGFNNNSCVVCLGFPGTLPVLNKEVLDKAIILTEYFCGFTSDRLIFDRKHYIYPDLPKGYQITQQTLPLGRKGNIKILDKDIVIDRIAIEEDAAKSIIINNNRCIDFNRCGTPLIEMCTMPDFTSIEQVLMFLKLLRNIAENLNIIDPKRSDCIRCDVNISIHGYDRVEMKNLNSLGAIKSALEYEIERQREIVSNGGYIVQETRSWNENERKTYVMRKKENERDYFFIPEYNIPNLQISNIKRSLTSKKKLLKTISLSNSFVRCNSYNWTIFSKFHTYLDVERKSKFINLCLNNNLSLIEKFFSKNTIKKIIDILDFLILEKNFNIDQITNFLSNKTNLLKDIKEIKNEMLEVKIDPKTYEEIALFINEIKLEQHELIHLLGVGRPHKNIAKLKAFFICKIKEKFKISKIDQKIWNILSNKLDYDNQISK